METADTALNKTSQTQKYNYLIFTLSCRNQRTKNKVCLKLEERSLDVESLRVVSRRLTGSIHDTYGKHYSDTSMTIHKETSQWTPLTFIMSVNKDTVNVINYPILSSSPDYVIHEDTQRTLFSYSLDSSSKRQKIITEESRHQPAYHTSHRGWIPRL